MERGLRSADAKNRRGAIAACLLDLDCHRDGNPVNTHRNLRIAALLIPIAAEESLLTARAMNLAKRERKQPS